MKKPLRTFLIIVGVLVLLIGYWGVDNFVYPIKVVHPNYSDVERVFAQLQFPSDWNEISSSENRGLHGRDCDPFNNSGCFHKSKTFKVTNASIESVRAVTGMGHLCSDLTVSDISYKDQAKPTQNFICHVDKQITVDGTVSGPKNEIYLAVSTTH